MNGVEERATKTTLIAEVDLPLFLAFKKYHKEFMIMYNAGVFNLQFGKATINKHEGHIQSVNIEERTYQYKSTPDT